MSYQLQVFYDGDCPVASREVRRLRRSSQAGRVQFTDITSEAFHAQSYGKKHEDFMRTMRARTRDGVWLDGADVLRQIYEELGMKFVVKVSRAPGVSTAVDKAYGWFEKNRLKLTGRKE